MKFLLSSLAALSTPFASAGLSGRSHRAALLAWHRAGTVQVYRRPSLLRLWAPQRETCAGSDYTE